MFVDEKEVLRLANLSALSFSEQESAEMVKDLNNIINYVSAVKNYDAQGFESLQKSVEIKDLRKDEPKPSMELEKLLANAPERGENVFIVPKVVD